MGIKKYINKINQWVKNNKYYIVLMACSYTISACVGFKIFLAIIASIAVHVIWMRGGE